MLVRLKLVGHRFEPRLRTNDAMMQCDKEYDNGIILPTFENDLKIDKELIYL